MSLKVFTDGTDTWCANDLADVALVYYEHVCATLEDEGKSLDDFEEVDGDEPITICNVHDKGADDKLTLTAREWAERNGRGLLCSTEW